MGSSTRLLLLLLLILLHYITITIATSVLQLTRNSYIKRKCQNLPDSNSPHDSWHLAKNISNNFISSFPPMSHSDVSSAVSSVSIGEFFAQTFACNSVLDDSGHIPPSPPPSKYIIPFIKITSSNDVLYSLSGLDSQKA